MAHDVKLPVLTTARLRQVAATAADTDTLCALLWQSEVRRYLCDDVMFSREEIAVRLAASIANWPAGLGHWALRDGAGSYIGFVELQPPPAAVPARSIRCASTPSRVAHGSATHRLWTSDLDRD